MSEGVQTRAWYQFGGLKGFEPGYLLLTPERRLTFVGPDRARFDVPLAEVTGVKFPKHWFDGGCKLTIAGEEHRVDFVRPNGAADVTYQLWEHAGAIGIAADAALVARKFSDIGSGRAAGKKWKQLLTEPATSRAAPAASQAPASDAFPAGWYADPQGQARLRWWDGAQWTAHVTH